MVFSNLLILVSLIEDSEEVITTFFISLQKFLFSFQLSSEFNNSCTTLLGAIPKLLIISTCQCYCWIIYEWSDRWILQIYVFGCICKWNLCSGLWFFIRLFGFFFITRIFIWVFSWKLRRWFELFLAILTTKWKLISKSMTWSLAICVFILHVLSGLISNCVVKPSIDFVFWCHWVFRKDTPRLVLFS